MMEVITESEKTVADVIKEMTQEQKDALYFFVGLELESDKEKEKISNEEARKHIEAMSAYSLEQVRLARWLVEQARLTRISDVKNHSKKGE